MLSEGGRKNVYSDFNNVLAQKWNLRTVPVVQDDNLNRGPYYPNAAYNQALLYVFDKKGNLLYQYQNTTDNSPWGRPFETQVFEIVKKKLAGEDTTELEKNITYTDRENHQWQDFGLPLNMYGK